MFQKQRHIDLTLPTSWQRCTLAQLREIAAAMTSVASRTGKYRPFDMLEVKMEVFFRLTGIEIVEPLNPRVPVEQQYYKCRLRAKTRLGRMRQWIDRNILGIDDTFSLYLEVLTQWLMEHPVDPSAPVRSDQSRRKHSNMEPGLLDWLHSESAQGLLTFPFRTVRRRRWSLWPSRSVEFHGPAPLMDGFTWQRFRFAQDYMGFYTDASNALVQLQKRARLVPQKELVAAARRVDLARAMFLATIFVREITFVSPDTGQLRRDFRYQSNQHSDYAPYFRGFSDQDWQIVLLWWQSQMHWLGQKYPKVFKQQKVKGGRTLNPLEIYTRTTATMEKYLSSTATDVDREPYTTIIQHLEDITRQNEETEKIRQQSKSKK